MSRLKPRIVLTIVDAKAKWEFSIVEGRLMNSGAPCPGPSKAMYRIARRALVQLARAPGKIEE